MLSIGENVFVPLLNLGIICSLHSLCSNVQKVLMIVRKEPGRLLGLHLQAFGQTEENELQSSLGLSQVLVFFYVIEVEWSALRRARSQQ
jgi:hypothetical protein